MHSIRTIGLILMTALIAPAMYAQRDIVLDLATTTSLTETADKNERFFVVVKNRMRTTYKVTVERELPQLEPLDLSQFQGQAGAPTCDKLAKAFADAWSTATNEADVGLLVASHRASAAACTSDQKEQLALAIADLTTATFGPYNLAAGEKLKFQISRTLPDEKAWELTVTAPPPGAWRMMYGFNFVPNEDEHYFLRARDDGKFDVVEERDENDDFSFVPSIYASWLSRRQQIRGWGWGLSAGLGFETDEPVVFAGPTFTYRENISINFGVVMQKRQTLNPRIDLSQPVEGTVTEEHLTRKEGYQPNWYIGIGFRFNDNPFKAEAPEDETPED